MSSLKAALKKHILTKSQAAKQAVAGKDMGKHGKKFGMIAQMAAEKYGSKAAGQKVAGAVFQRLRRMGKL